MCNSPYEGQTDLDQLMKASPCSKVNSPSFNLILLQIKIVKHNFNMTKNSLRVGVNDYFDSLWETFSLLDYKRRAKDREQE